MLKRFKIPGIKIPKLYIADNATDIALAQQNGLPYIVWHRSEDDLIKAVLRPVLEKLFPYIKWKDVLGPRKYFETEVEIVEGCEAEANNAWNDTEDTEVADIAEDYRWFDGTGEEGHKKLPLEKYIGDISCNVDIEVLQRLQLLPKFLGDIVDCLRNNLAQTKWTEGYNKKLGVATGTFSSPKELPNLIILDVSGSIPRGISATMITMIDTLRTQLHADLIITASISKYYKFGEELPDPQTIRDEFDYGNEANQFYEILKDHVAGKEWGHVVSFGDYDAPSSFGTWKTEEPLLPGTKVNMVHHYHTWDERGKTGYALWCDKIGYLGGQEFNNEWCEIIRR